MNIRKIARFIWFTVALLTASFSAEAQQLTNPAGSTKDQPDFIAANATEINAFLQENFSKGNSGMVVGLLDEHGSWRSLQMAKLSDRNAETLMAEKEYVGIGAAYGLDAHDHTLRISKVFPDTSAAKAGVQAGWIVQEINGVSTSGKSPTECVALGPGSAGAVVRMELVSPERTETNTLDLVKRRFLAD